MCRKCAGFAAVRFHDGAEKPLEIRIGGRPVAVTMRTPGHDEELALGFYQPKDLEALARHGLEATLREHALALAPRTDQADLDAEPLLDERDVRRRGSRKA
jgi:FdhD/NarQ family